MPFALALKFQIEAPHQLTYTKRVGKEAILIMDTRKPTEDAWHCLNLADVTGRLDATDGGLSEAEVEAGLKQYGPNTLPKSPAATLWQIALRQFRSPLIYRWNQ